MAADIEVPYPRPTRILSVDPGGRAGVAVFLHDGNEFVLDGAWEVNGNVRAISDTVSRFAKGGGVLVIERQFFRVNGPGVQINGIETLLRHRHQWEIIAEVFSVPQVLVYPASWQSKMLSGKGRGDTKGDARTACIKHWPRLTEIWEDHEDARDAALLGRFYAGHVEKKML